MACFKLNCNVNVNECLSGLWASRRLGRPKSAIKKLKKEMAILEAKRDDIKNQIKEAEREGKIPTKEVSKWVQDVEILEGKVADIDKDFQTMRCCSCSYFSCSCFNQIGSTSSQTQEAGDQVPIRESSNYCSIILRVVDKLEEVNRLMSRDGERNLIATDPSRLEFGIQKLEKEMARLRAKRDDIKNEITEKEREGKIPTNQVSRWLLEVETLEGQVTDIKLDFQSISCFSCNNCSNQTGGTSSQTQQAGDQVPFIESSNCCSINQRATEKLGEANDLMSRASALDPIATDLSKLESGIQKLEKEMARLRAKRDDIKNKITEAEREGKILTEEVSQWLLEVERLEGQVTGIKLDFRSISCFSCSNCFNQTGGTSSQIQQAGDQVPIRESSNCCSIIRRAAKKLSEANELMSRAEALDPIATVGPPEPTVMLPISHRSPVGIESYVEDIVGYVDGGKGDIIGIYGMGGVGKTTVLKSIQQHYLLKHTRFDHVIWVVASKDCQLKMLQMDIAKSLGLPTLQENDDEQTCGGKLFSYLKNRNCLLLLDDIWEHVDLQLLGMTHSTTERGLQQQPHKVVVFTTRSETVCAQMKAKKEIKVKCLNPVQAWQLFEENSNKDVLRSDAGIKFVAEELTKECAGLPLALVTVARAMSGKKSWEVWNDTLTQIRDEHTWTSVCLPKDSLMYKAFKLSYDSLENDSIRKCLLCCALWPEDYEIDKFKELIPCWIGCGIICDFNVINEAFAKGCSHLEDLIAASLLEKCTETNLPYEDRCVKMHNVIRDMALLMVSGLQGSTRKWIVKVGIGFSDLPKQEEWQEVERALFWGMNDITFLQDYGAFTFPKLSMLILCGNTDWKTKTIPPSLFSSMPHLTYLDLYECCITELPMEIGSLTELQYLNLTRNPITRLPVEIGCLIKLEYLLLRGTDLEIVPNEMISKLSMLKWLDITQIYHAPAWWYDELKSFKGRHRLSVEIDIIATTDNIERLNMLSNVSIWKLTLYGYQISELPNYDLGIPQWGCRTGDKLECLRILNIGLDRLVLAASIGSESNFRCLKELQFHSLNLLEEISLNGVRLYNLRVLDIFNCPLLKDVSWVLQLPCLSILSISDCQRMKELITDVEDSNSISSIERLILSHMPNLNRIANRQLHFPYLEYIYVMDCPNFKNLSFGTEILKNCRLKSIEGDDSWWNNLDWDDECIKDSLTQPYFREPSNCYSINRRGVKTLDEANELMSQASALDPIATDLSRPGIEKLKKEMARLRAKRGEVKNQINEAEREGKIRTNEVDQWLREVKELEDQAAVIKQDFQSMKDQENVAIQTQQAGDHLIRESSNCYSINRRVAKKFSKANELMSRASALDPIATVGPPKPTMMLSISHRPPVGMESYVKDIVGYINGREGNIIGICGMGGVGKTTILKSIQQHYNHNIFDCVIWVVASKDCQLKRLQMDIAKSIRLKTLKESDDERTCGDKLFRYLKNKNCLLLLDDIWEHLDLKLLGMAYSATERGQQQQQPRKVVVLTTRNQTVCTQMKAEKKIKVKCLNLDQAWQLFEQNSDEDALNPHARIKFVAKELVEECAGLPLALITVARAMSGKKSWKVWNDAVNQIRDNHEWTTIGLSEDSAVMYKAFKLSYNSLENDSLRECLLCCALWPEDYSIHKFEELIPCWIGCGIIREFNVINEAFTKGCSRLEALIAASLLEHSSSQQDYYEAQHVKMHDIIRDMALLMVSRLNGNGTKWIVKAGIGLHSLPRQEEWQEAERASFMHNHNLSLPEYETSTFPKLSMLILHGNHLRGIPRILFTNMPLLTYLNLSNNRGIRKLPQEIGSLTELQYLNLSSTGITSLPLEFGCLRKLEYLLLRYNTLDEVPNGTISNLLMLKWLDIRDMYPISEWWLDELKDFKGHYKLSLGIDINPVNLEKLDTLPNVCVWELTVSGWKSSESSEHNLGTLQWSHKLSDNLECLTITDVPGDKLMMNANVDCESNFQCLKALCFITLEQLEKFWWNGVAFNNLHDLRIVGCFKLKDVNWVLQLPCLKLLDITASREMEELISNVGSSNSSFGIKMLILNEMKNLHSIVHQPLHFPCLEYMCVYSCPRLTKLPFGAEILKSGLKEIRGDQTWWDNLDWNDKSDKDSLTPYFRQQFP